MCCPVKTAIERVLGTCNLQFIVYLSCKSLINFTLWLITPIVSQLHIELQSHSHNYMKASWNFKPANQKSYFLLLIHILVCPTVVLHLKPLRSVCNELKQQTTNWWTNLFTSGQSLSFIWLCVLLLSWTWLLSWNKNWKLQLSMEFCFPIKFRYKLFWVLAHSQSPPHRSLLAFFLS